MFRVSTARRSALALFVGSIIAGNFTFSQRVLAQEQPQAAEEEQEVVVTGSRIRRVEVGGPSPIVTITADELENRGYNSVLEAINDLPQNAGGGFDQSAGTELDPGKVAALRDKVQVD